MVCGAECFTVSFRALHFFHVLEGIFPPKHALLRLGVCRPMCRVIQPWVDESKHTHAVYYSQRTIDSQIIAPTHTHTCQGDFDWLQITWGSTLDEGEKSQKNEAISFHQNYTLWTQVWLENDLGHGASSTFKDSDSVPYIVDSILKFKFGVQP